MSDLLQHNAGDNEFRRIACRWIERLERRLLLSSFWKVEITGGEQLVMDPTSTIYETQGTARVINPIVEADDWKSAVIAAVSASTTSDRDAEWWTFSGTFPDPNRFRIDTAGAIAGETTMYSWDNLPPQAYLAAGVLERQQKVIAFEDDIDADFNDAYWTLEVTEVATEEVDPPPLDEGGTVEPTPVRAVDGAVDQPISRPVPFTKPAAGFLTRDVRPGNAFESAASSALAAASGIHDDRAADSDELSTLDSI